MLEKLQLVSMAQALASHSSSRLQLIAGNIANADTPGYQAKDLLEFNVDFASVGDQPLRQTRSGHIPSGPEFDESKIVASAFTTPNGNSVSIDIEMAKAVQAREAHTMALSIYQSASSIIRVSLGRG